MTNKYINFKRERDFGDIFNATFNFIGQEFKRLGSALLYYVVPFLILSAIASTIYSVKAQEMMQSMMSTSSTTDPFAAFKVMGSLSGFASLMFIFSLISSNMMLCTVYSYIKVYVSNGGNEFTINDVWREVMKNFWRVLGAAIVVGLLVTVGLVFCFIPGIYLGVVLSILIPILVFEEISFSDAFSRSFKLIKKNWWFTFGIFIVALIIFYILSILVSVPSLLLGFKSFFSNMKHIEKTGMMFSTDFYIVNSLTSLLTQFFTVIPVVVTAFLYYSFVEKREKPSLMNKIDQISEHE